MQRIASLTVFLHLLLAVTACGNYENETSELSQSPTLTKDVMPLPKVFKQIAEMGYVVDVYRQAFTDEELRSLGGKLTEDWALIKPVLKKTNAARAFLSDKIKLNFSNHYSIEHWRDSISIDANDSDKNTSLELVRSLQLYEAWFLKQTPVSDIYIKDVALAGASVESFETLLNSQAAIAAFIKMHIDRVDSVYISDLNGYDLIYKNLFIDPKSKDFAAIMQAIKAKDIKKVGEFVREF